MPKEIIFESSVPLEQPKMNAPVIEELEFESTYTGASTPKQSQFKEKDFGRRYFKESAANPLFKDIEWERAEGQPWYEQLGAATTQAVVGSVLGQTIQGMGTLLAIPDMIGGDMSMDNPIYDLGKGISDWAAETTPIYQTGDRFTDSGYWFQGLTSAASAASFLLPGWAFTKVGSAIAKGLKLGTTAGKMLTTGVGAFGMRHIEGAMEANDVRNKFLQEGMSGYQQGKIDIEKLRNSLSDEELQTLHQEMQQEIQSIPLQLPNPETGEMVDNSEALDAVRKKYQDIIAEKAITKYADEAAKLTYIADYSNLIFDIAQLGALTKPLSKLTRGTKAMGKVATAEGMGAKTWYGNIGQRMLNTSKVGLIEMTEGIEEQVNYISAQEGERHGKILAGLQEDDGSDLATRVGSKYAKEDEFWDSFIFGAIGGVGFRMIGDAVGMGESSKVEQRKLAEIQSRTETLKSHAAVIGDIVNNPNMSKEDKKSSILEQADAMGHEIGLRGSLAGNMEYVEKWLNKPELVKELQDLGFGEESDVKEVIDRVKESALLAENLYKKHYTNLYEQNIDEGVKQVMVQDRMALDATILDNFNEIQELEAQYSKLSSKDLFMMQRGINPQNVAMLNKFAVDRAINEMNRTLKEEKLTPEAKARIEKVLSKLQETSNEQSRVIEKAREEAAEAGVEFAFPKLTDLNLVDPRIVYNIGRKQYLSKMNETLTEELSEKVDPKNIKKEAAKAKEKITKPVEEFIQNDKDKETTKATEEAEKLRDSKKNKEEATKPEGTKIATDVNPEARQQLNTMGYKDSQIDELSREEREGILTNGTPAEEYFAETVEEEFISKETTAEKRNRLLKIREKRGEEFNLDIIPDTPQKFTNNVAELSLPLAPSIPGATIDLDASFGESDYDLDMSKVRLLEIRGRNSDGRITGTVRISDKNNNSFNAEVIFKDDAELAELTKVTPTEQNTSDVLDSNEETTNKDGDTPAEAEGEFSTPDNIFRKESAISINYSASNSVIVDKEGRRGTVDYDVSPIALSLSDWETLQTGDKVEVSLDTEYDGPVLRYDADGKPIRNAKGEVQTDTKTYAQLDVMNKPIKIQKLINGNKVTIGYLPTLDWVSAKTDTGEYLNIANEDGLNAEKQIENLKKIRQAIFDAGTSKVHSFKVNKGHGHLTKTTERVKTSEGKWVRVKQPVNEALPNTLKSKKYKDDFKPIVVFTGQFNTGENTHFPEENIATNDIEKLKDSRNKGAVILMLPSAVKDMFIPTAVTIPKLDNEVAKGLHYIITQVALGNTEVINNVSKTTGKDISTRKGLRDFLHQYIFFSSDAGKNASKDVPRIVFSIKNSTIDVHFKGKRVHRVSLNIKKSLEQQLKDLLPYIEQQRITVRSENINSEDKFVIPTLKTNEAGEGILDLNNDGTFNGYLLDRATTDIIEVKVTDDNYVTVVQPTINLEGSIEVIPIGTDETTTTKPKNKKVSRLKQRAENLAGITDEVDVNSVTAAKPEEGIYNEGEDMSMSELSAPVFLTLNDSKELYAKYKLLTKKGTIRTLPFKTEEDIADAERQLESLNRSFRYGFMLRKTSDGKRRILMFDKYAQIPQSTSDDAISELKREEIKLNATSLLVSDGDYVFGAERQRQIVGNIKYLVYSDLLETASQGKRMSVNKAFANALEDFEILRDDIIELSEMSEEEFAKQNTFIKTLGFAKMVAEDLKRITKPEVWQQFRGQTIQDLKALGIEVRKDVLREENNFLLEDVDVEENELSVNENDHQNEKNYSIETFQINPKNTASINVKLMLSKIPDSRPNYLGLESYIPFDTAFDELTMMLSPEEGKLSSYLEQMKLAANNNSSKAYLKHVIEYLQDENTTTQLKNQFTAVMNKNAGNFLMVLWKKENNGYSTTIINSNRNSAHFRVIEQWAENIKNSPLATMNEKGEKVINKEKANALKQEMLELKGKSKEEHTKFLNKLLYELAIDIPPSALKILTETTAYSKLLNNEFKRKGTFINQFSWTEDGKPSGVFSALVHALTSKEEVDSSQEVTEPIEVNNPFEGKHKESAAMFLAKLSAQHSETLFSSSHRNVEGKTIYDYSFHIPLTSRLKEFNNGTELKNKLKTQAFSRNAFWLKDSNRGHKIHYNDTDGLKQNAKGRDGIVRDRMSNREQEFTSMMLFQQPNKEGTAKFLGLTMSDKTRSPIIEAPKFKFNLLTSGVQKDGTITKEALPFQVRNEVGNIVKAEAARIREIYGKIKEHTENGTLEEYKRNVGEQYFYGSQYFYLFPELNDIIWKDGVVDPTFLVGKQLEALIDSAMNSIVDVVNNTITQWQNDGTTKLDSKGKLEHQFNLSYVKEHISSYKGLNLAAFAAADLEINNFIFNANMLQIVQGDPALYYNTKWNKLSPREKVENTLKEYQKREAKDAAPGELGTTEWEIRDGNKVWRGNTHYTVQFVKDDGHGSLTDGYLQSLEAYTGKLDRTDAQEYTTVKEKITAIMNHGRIPDAIFISIMNKIDNAKDGYYELDGEELEFIMGPDKPVQIVREDIDGHEHTYYIKSSSFPLIPQFTKDTDLDKVRRAMESSGTDRIAFVSATKTGARNIVEVFDKEGNVKDGLDFKKTQSLLSRKGFSIQQDVPYDDTKHNITVVSQADRLLLQGLANVDFEYNGKNVKGKDLKKLKEKIRSNLMDMSREELFTKIGVKLTDDNKPYVADMNKFLEGIREEAIDRKWNINDVMSLNIVDGNVVVPLGFNNSAERIETLITSMFNKVIKQKINGKSLVQGSSSGLRNNVKTLEELTSKDKNGIVWIKGTDNDFNPQKGLTFIDSKSGKLAQVVLPWKYQAEMEKFLIPDTSMLDISKIDKELLNIVGFRIPNQGHSSQLSIQIVGFLPKNMGDLVLVPGEITKQMGSDFDVDKLYTYIFNHVVNDDGKLVKIPEFVTVEGDVDVDKLNKWVSKNFPTKINNLQKYTYYVKESKKEIQEGIDFISKLFQEENVETVDEVSVKKDVLKELGLTYEDINVPSRKFFKRAILQNAYIGIHLNVLSNPKVMKLMTEPLDAKDLEITGKKGAKIKEPKLFLSRQRQLEDFEIQQAGKKGVAIFSRAVVGLAMIEDYDIRLGTIVKKEEQPFDFIGFKDDKGNVITLNKLSGTGTSTFNGEIRSKIRNLIIQQSGAVDNAKTPVLDMNGLHSLLFNASIAMSILQSESGKALDLRYNSYFLRQPIIQAYVKELRNLSDSLNTDFVPDRKEEAIERVKEQFKSKLINPEYQTIGKSYSPNELLKLLEITETSSETFIQDQLEILAHFTTLDTIGTELGEIFTALSSESKGVGKGYWEASQRQEQIFKLGKKSLIRGAEELVGDNQSGKIASYVGDAVNILSQIFPYNTEVVKGIINEIELENGKDRVDIEMRKDIWEALKSFIFTDPQLDTTAENRNDLFYGENSVAKQLNKFLETKEGKVNKFALKLKTKVNNSKGLPDIITFNAAISERTDEQELVKYFVDMFTSANEETRNLAERLLQYAYAQGGIQQALQFVKYIPTPYLSATNFGKRLEEISTLLKGENGIIDSNIFIEQFFQHNPNLARKHNVEKIGKIAKEGITFNTENDRLAHLKTVKNNKVVFVDYISIRDTSKNKWILLKKVETNGNKLVYKPIPLKGGFGKNFTAYNEYNFNGEQVTSTIPENNPEGTITPVVKPKITPTIDTTIEIGEILNTEFENIKASKYVDVFNAEGKEALDFALSQLETDRYKALIPLFTKENLFPKFKVILDNNLKDKNGNIIKGKRKGDTIIINPKEHKRIADFYGRKLSNEDIENTLIHELVHIPTADAYRAYRLKEEHPLLTDKVREKFRNIDTLFMVAYNKLSKEDQKKIELIRNKKLDDSSLSVEDKTGLYGFTSPTEFMAEVLTKKEFQQRLNEMSFNSQKTIWERFKDLIRQVYNEFIKGLGFTVNEQSVLTNTLVEVIDLLETIGKDENVITSKVSEIYSQLGNKTESENVHIEPWSNLKNATEAIVSVDEDVSAHIVSTRIQGTNEHFGNPFSHAPTGKTQGLIKTETIKEAVEAYTQWIIQEEDISSSFYEKYLNNINSDLYDNLLQRRQWIREQLESGELKNKPIFYYKELGQPSHATALDYLINKYDWNTKNKKEVTDKEQILKDKLTGNIADDIDLSISPLVEGYDKNKVNLVFGEEGQVQYVYDVVNKVFNNLNKINNWAKGIKNEDVLWTKIQKDLQIPLEQIELLKNSRGNTIEEKLLDLVGNYGYSVEVNTAKNKQKQFGSFEAEPGIPIEAIMQNRNAAESEKGEPTSYYANLTVPGGTNYTENEISTPLITPSIKGHAQFSTDKGIGWFRSDEKISKEAEYVEKLEDEYLPFPMKTKEVEGSKTRRILEIQSDLFQKGRDSKELVRETGLETIDYDEEGSPLPAPIYNDTKGNQFLQLLNKDSNWVTFFIKSIVQDSAKKGYEKVLFPKGETAAKIEGHQTIADEIKALDTRIAGLKLRFKTDFGIIEQGKNKGMWFGYDKPYNNKLLAERSWTYGIEQLEKQKQNLKSQGIEKLKPIEAFYEIRVGKILEKQFGKNNVKTITDEYGNQWREITIVKPKENVTFEGDLGMSVSKYMQTLTKEQRELMRKLISTGQIKFKCE